MRLIDPFRYAALPLMLVLFSVAAQAQSAQCDVRQSQVVLKKLGYDPGPADGLWGRGTAAAVKQFQNARNIPGASGTLDAPTCAALETKRAEAGIAVPKPPAKKQSASMIGWGKIANCRFLKDRKLNNRLASKGSHVMSLKKGGRMKLATGRVRGGPYDAMGVGTYIRFDAPTRICGALFRKGGATVVRAGLRLDPGTTYTMQ